MPDEEGTIRKVTGAAALVGIQAFRGKSNVPKQ